MEVKLSLLDRKDALHYSNPVDVTIFDKTYEIIGSCKVFRNDNGNHFGELKLDRQVDPNYYFYYRGRANEGGIFIFAGLDFTPTELEDHPTTKLKEMIVR